MRLTLRTMLAYMDDILEPEDASDIGKKLEESELAKTIMQRLRESIRRVRLGSPPALGHGMGLDPNSVAEYLDNTLPAEQVGEFEKICLESDMHLAEVGACHQILTLVLGEPAEVDAVARERMYHLTAPAAPVEPAAAVVAPAAPVAAFRPVAAQPVRRVKPEVPDYLRQSRSRHWGAIAAVIALVLVCGGVATAVFLPEMRKILAGRQEAGQEENRNDETKVPDSRVGNLIVEPSTPEIDDSADQPGASGDQPGITAEQAAPGVGGDVDAAGPVGEPGNDNGLMPDEGMPPDELPPAEPGAAQANPGAGDGAQMPPGVPAVGAAAGVGAPPAGPAPAEEPPTGEVMGRYLNKQDVLLRLDPQTQLWRRLAATPSLAAGDRLMGLPDFRSTINLMAGVTLEPVDAARFTLLGAEGGVPTIGLDYGRFVLSTAGKPQNSVRLRIGDYEAQLTFVDGESTMGIHVQRIWIPGQDPTKAAGPLVADLYVTSGSVIWTAGGAPATWQAPLHTRLDADGVKLADHEIAKWTVGQALTKVERDAADVVEHELATDRPTTLSVKELLGDRRSEVRALGIRIAANVDEFLPVVKMLHDDGYQRHLWQTEVDALRAAMVRDPETAQLIQAAFSNFRPADGDELFHLLWGYSGEELADGGMNKLVDYLNNDSLEFRVLAFTNLYEISGRKTLGYRPEASAATRQKAVNEWKKRIKEIKPPPGG